MCNKRVLNFNDYKDWLLKNKIILKSQQRFKSERHNVYTEEINKIALSGNDDKRLQTFGKIVSNSYRTSAGRVCKTMINLDDYTNENKTEHKSKWRHIRDHPYRILIVGGSGSGKINGLLNLINNQTNIDKIYSHAKDPFEAKYQYLINKREKIGLNHYDDPKAFMDYSNDMQDL